MQLTQMVISALITLGWIFLSFWLEPIFRPGSPAWLGLTIFCALAISAILFWGQLPQFFVWTRSAVTPPILLIIIGAVLLLAGAVWQFTSTRTASLVAKYLSEVPIASTRTKPTPEGKIFHFSADFQGHRITIFRQKNQPVVILVAAYYRPDKEVFHWLSSLGIRKRRAILDGIKQDTLLGGITNVQVFSYPGTALIEDMLISRSIFVEKLSRDELSNAVTNVIKSKELVDLKLRGELDSARRRP